MKKLMLAIYLLSLTGCATFRKDDGFRVTGGTAEERAMVHGAVNHMVPFLQGRGFPNVKAPTGTYWLKIHPTTEIWRFPDGGEQGVGLLGGMRVGAASTKGYMDVFRPLHPWIANHEVTHMLMGRAGYVKESEAHDRRAFDDGAHFPRGARRVK